MKQNNIQRLALAGSVLALLMTMARPLHAESNIQKPNVIFILCDDLGYGDLGVTGHPYVRTPNIDKLAAEGIQFEHGYMSGAWCAPSRYALASGRYPSHYFNKSQVMDTEAMNVYRVFNNADYKTAHFGKWHMSGSGRTKDDPIPKNYGVGEYFIHNGNGEQWTKEERQAPHWRENTTRKYVDLTIDFIKRSQEAGKPFFVNLWVCPPHSYIDPTPEMLEPYKDLEVDLKAFKNPLQRDFLRWISKQGDLQDAMRSFCADVTELDNQLGRLMAAIDELRLNEDTVVVFSSDNGPAPIDAVHNLKILAQRMKERPMLINNVGSAGPYRDRKISLNDGGVRVPLIVRWPGEAPAGRVNTETIFTGVDFLPTMAALAGAKVPEGLDGENLAGAFKGQAVTRSKPHFWQDRPGWSAVRHGRWKAHLKKGRFSLFDILEDPSESNDLAKEKPEVARDFRRLIEAFEASVAN